MQNKDLKKSAEQEVTSLIRESNYDFLRFLAMVGVILNHVSDSFLVNAQTTNMTVTYVFEGLGAFAVPMFFMLTGAFAFDGVESGKPGEFYRHVIKKMGKPLLFFFIIYFAWNLRGGVCSALHLVLTGWYGHPLWYMCTLMVIYFIIPAIKSLQEKYSERKYYHYFVWIYCVWAILSGLFDSYGSISWGTGCVASFFAYVMLGNEIKHISSKKNNLAALLLICCGFTVFIVEFIIVYTYDFGVYSKFIKSSFAPPTVFGSILIFSGFSMVDIPLKFPITVKYSFYIYLWHRIVLDVIIALKRRSDIQLLNNSIIMIPVMTIVVFAISLLLSILFRKFIKHGKKDNVDK